MNEYELLGELHELIDNDVDNRINEWIDKHNVNYCLLYPLAAVELGAMNGEPETTDNLFRRCVASFVYAKTVASGKGMYIKKFNIPGLKKYLREYEQTLIPIFQNYRFAREINDINHVSKARLTQITENKYQLTTSLVTDKYKEENFYFFGEDDPQSNNAEKKQTMDLHQKFWEKIILQQIHIKNLMKFPDEELYQECISIVEKDINKWDASVRSEVFDRPKQIAQVVAFFYYHAMIKTIGFRIGTLEGEEYIDNADECIMMFDIEECIHDISAISNIRMDKVRRIIEYFINEGNSNILEFPLFKIEDTLITIPSLILVNDWQFTIINGHYAKNKQIKNRDKTISQVTEKRIDKLLSGVENIVTAKTQPYSFVDENGENQCSDVDYAIYDKEQNVILVIEAKWINKHYNDEIDKRYGMILQTLNTIYSKQISKHKVFLSKRENIDFLFREDDRYVRNEEEPEIYYLAVDKRNQMHVQERHMISEYMLMYFLRKYLVNDKLDLVALWDEISNLETKVEYIAVSSEFHEIQVGDNVVLVEKDDLDWN